MKLPLGDCLIPLSAGEPVRWCAMRRAIAAGVAATAFFLASFAWAQSVAVVAATPADEAVVIYLTQQFEGGVTWRVAANARDPEALMAEARTWPERLVVMVDSQQAVVRVLRVSDGTILSRRLDPATATAPYAVALAGVELLELAGHAPETAPPPAVAAEPPRQEPPSLPPASPPPKPHQVELRVSVTAGGVFTHSIDGDVGLNQAFFGAGFVLILPRQWNLAIELRGAGLGSDDQTVRPLSRISSATVEYDRTELGLRLTAGQRDGRLVASGYLEGGPAFVDASGVATLPRDSPDGDEGEEIQGGADRLAPWFGGGGELRYMLIGGFSVGASAGVVLFPRAFSYEAGGETAFDEGNVHLRAQALVMWEGP